jgi:hypothetical protein
MVELFLKTAGAPPAMIDVLNLIQAEGFGAFAYKIAVPDDPNWTSIGAAPGSKRNGVWLRAEGPASRVTIAIFMEGATDEFLEKVSSIGVPADASLSRL